jgi:GTP-binding protein HflX
VAEVYRVLGEIGAASTPQILVLNKCDRLAHSEQDPQVLGTRLLAQARQSSGASAETATPAVLVSGLTGEGLAKLFDLIDQVLPFDIVETVRFRIPLRDGAAIALLHEYGKVRAQGYDGNLCEIEVEAPESLRRRLKRYLVRNSTAAVENSVYK